MTEWDELEDGLVDDKQTVKSAGRLIHPVAANAVHAVSPGLLSGNPTIWSHSATTTTNLTFSAMEENSAGFTGDWADQNLEELDDSLEIMTTRLVDLVDYFVDRVTAL